MHGSFHFVRKCDVKIVVPLILLGIVCFTILPSELLYVTFKFVLKFFPQIFH